MKIHTLKKGVIERFLERMKRRDSEITAPDLDSVLKEILSKANEFVPSEAGSILLDDPHKKSEKHGSEGEELLYFVACFGPRSESLLGSTITSSAGIAGLTYTAARPYICADVSKDRNFKSDADDRLKSMTRSVLCVPIVIGKSVCGVIELLNRKGHGSYTKGDLKLLEIFAGYTSTLIQNALDAKRNRELTRRDDLTGLYNDRFFHQQLSDELRRAKQTRRDVSLLFMDLDNFKYINDTLGHLAGSRTLAEVGALLKNTLENDDASLIRYGGDEFAVILPGRSKAQAATVAEKVRAAIEGAVFLKKKSQTGEQAYNIKGIITCSIGVSSFIEDGLNGGTLEEEKIAFIRKADRAMYKAKECGKNCVYSGEPCFDRDPLKLAGRAGRVSSR